MVAKLKTALVLLIIGSISGLSIVGMNSLTEERINENRLRAQYEDYVTMFPELADIEEEPIDNDGPLDMKFTVLDSDGEELGSIYRGHDTNSQGDITVLVGISGDTLVDVIISSTDNTPSYVTPLEENHISKLSDISIGEISYDASTGATITYESVQEIIDAAIVYAGVEISDPELEAYQALLENADDYESYLKYSGKAFANENTVFAEDGKVIAHGFLMTVEEEDVRLLFAPDTTFLGAVALAEEPSTAVTDLLSGLDAFTGTPVVDIDTTTLPAEFEPAFSELATFLLDYERLNDARVKEETLLDDTDTITGFRYTVFKDGHSGTANEIAVTVNTDGEVTETEIVNHYDTPDYVDADVKPNLDHYDGYTLTDMSDADATDAFSGASNTGGSVVHAITTALELHERRLKYAEIYDQMDTVDKTYIQGYDTVLRRITVYDTTGAELGVIYEGHDINSRGPITVYVGITNGTLEAVTIPYHGNTPEYVNGLVNDYIDPLAGTDTDNITYDAETGATTTYTSVQTVIDEAVEAENERSGE